MHHLALFALGIGASMFTRDIVYTMSTAFVAHGRGWAAAGCDILGDWTTLLSIGGGAAAALHGGLETAVVVFGVIALGSALGTRGGVAVAGWMEKKFPVPQRAKEHTPL